MTKKSVVKILSQSFLPIQGRYPRIHGEAVTLRKAGCEVLVVGWDRTGRCVEREMVNGLNIQRIRVKSSEMRGPYQIPFLALFSLKAFITVLPIDIDVIHALLRADPRW